MRNRKSQAGFSLLELMIVVAIMLVIIAIAIPSYLQAKKAGNHVSAAANVRGIVNAENMYKQANGTYATNLATLGTAKLIDPQLALGTKGGYTYVDADDAAGGFIVTAEPTTTADGNKAFCDSVDGTMYQDGNSTTPGTATGCSGNLTNRVASAVAQ